MDSTDTKVNPATQSSDRKERRKRKTSAQARSTTDTVGTSGSGSGSGGRGGRGRGSGGGGRGRGGRAKSSGGNSRDRGSNARRHGQASGGQHEILKRVPHHFPAGKTDLYVGRNSQFQVQMKKAEKLLEQGHSQITIHGLGAAINRAINVALQLQHRSPIPLVVSTQTSTVPLIDDMIPTKELISAGSFGEKVQLRGSGVSGVLSKSYTSYNENHRPYVYFLKITSPMRLSRGGWMGAEGNPRPKWGPPSRIADCSFSSFEPHLATTYSDPTQHPIRTPTRTALF